MTRMQINGSDTGTVRLFHIDLPREAISRFVTQAGTGEWPLKYGLGARELRASFVDVVDIRDLGDMSLSQYMAEAHGVSGDDFRVARPQIDALRGHALILPAQAFATVTQELTVSTPIRWVGTFSEARGKRPGPKLRSQGAAGQTAQPSAGPLAGRSGGSPLLKLLMLGVGIVALLVLALGLR
jgi:hypothetical protein